MTSLQQRIAVYASLSSNLLTQLNELDQLRDRVRQAQLATRSSLPVGPTEENARTWSARTSAANVRR
jgi:hypothetical protein